MHDSNTPKRINNLIVLTQPLVYNPESVDPVVNMLKAQYLLNSWRCCLATIANNDYVCSDSEAVRSAMLY